MAMNIRYLRNEFNDYMIHAANARVWNRIPGHWISGYDHITYQASTPRTMETILDGLAPNARQITCIEKDGPFEVAIKLAGPLVNNNVRVNWVKLKEIDKTSPGPHWEGVSALNVLVGSLDTMKSRLTIATNLNAEEEGGVLKMDVNGTGRTLNFIESPLSAVAEQLIEEGYAVPILPKRVSEPGSVRSQDQ
jgi:hypothetical protein